MELKVGKGELLGFYVEEIGSKSIENKYNEMTNRNMM